MKIVVSMCDGLKLESVSVLEMDYIRHRSRLHGSA